MLKTLLALKESMEKNEPDPTEEEVPSIGVLKDLGVDVDRFLEGKRAVLGDKPVRESAMSGEEQLAFREKLQKLPDVDANLEADFDELDCEEIMLDEDPQPVSRPEKSPLKTMTFFGAEPEK